VARLLRVNDDLESFGVDGDVSDEERAYLSALKRSIDGRFHPWCVREHWSGSGALLVGLHIDAPEIALLTVGVRVSDGDLHGDRMDHQSYTFPVTPTDMAIDSTGSPVELAAATATWFDGLLRRPIVREEWVRRRRVYATRYVLADTGEPLSQSYNRDLAPRGQADQLIRDGHVFGKGWIQVSGLGPPDRVSQIRP
jgi:hypothetical protein